MHYSIWALKKNKQKKHIKCNKNVIKNNCGFAGTLTSIHDLLEIDTNS